MGVCNCSMYCCSLLHVHSSIAIILMGKRELIALLNLSAWCLVMVERLFLAVPRGCLQFVIVVFPDHTHLLFFQNNEIEKVQRTAARLTCRRWRNTSSVGVMLDELEWPSLEARRDQSSLFLFHKIHCGAVFIERDKYNMTPAHRLKSTRSSHSAQYCTMMP